MKVGKYATETMFHWAFDESTFVQKHVFMWHSHIHVGRVLVKDANQSSEKRYKMRKNY